MDGWRGWRAGVVGSAAIVLAATGCRAATEPAATDDEAVAAVEEDIGAPASGGKVVFGLTAESSGWSPVADQWALDGHFVASAVYDPLMAVAPDRQIVPELAKTIEHNADFTRWTIHVREGVQFHNGTPLDAAAVKANLDASRRGLGAIALSPIESIEVLDRLSVIVTMKSPWSAFPSTLAGQQGYIAAPETLLDGSASRSPIGTGPFVFERWAPDRSVELTKNAHYWQHGKPYLDEIEFRPIPDNASRGAALASGTLDLMITYEPSDVITYRSEPGYRVATDLEAEETVVVLNAGRPPFDHPAARRAIALATDQAQVTETMGAGVLEPANGPFASGEPWYEVDTNQPQFDIDEARVQADAYRRETGRPLEFRLSTFPDATRLRQVQLLQQMWAAVGADVHIETLDQAAFIKPLINGEFDATVISNFGTADPDFNYLFWHSSLVAPPGELSINFSHTVDPVIDAALDAGRRTNDVIDRAEQYQLIARRLNDNVAYVWLYRTPTSVVAADRVRGLSNLGNAGFARPDGKPWLAHFGSMVMRDQAVRPPVTPAGARRGPDPSRRGRREPTHRRCTRPSHRR
jgi:peptide/nickel transport system substrate-binding protein